MNIDQDIYSNIFNNSDQYRFNLKSKYNLKIKYKKVGEDYYFINNSLNSSNELNSLIGFGLSLTGEAILPNQYLDPGNETTIKIKFVIPCVGYGNPILPESFLTKKTDNDESVIKTSYHIDTNVRINGDLHVADDITAFATYSASDINLKKDIFSLNNCLEVVDQLNPVGFKWKKNDKDEVGFIAQEIAEIIPEIAEEVNNHKVISESKIIAYLVGAIQELDKELKDLESKQLKQQ